MHLRLTFLKTRQNFESESTIRPFALRRLIKSLWAPEDLRETIFKDWFNINKIDELALLTFKNLLMNLLRTVFYDLLWFP